MTEHTKSKKKTQVLALLGLLMTTDSGVSPLEARHVLGIERLAARVLDLKARGYVIHTEIRTDVQGKKYARYYLMHKPNVEATLPSPAVLPPLSNSNLRLVA